MRKSADRFDMFPNRLTWAAILQIPKPAAGATFVSPALKAELVEVLCEWQLRAQFSSVVCSFKNDCLICIHNEPALEPVQNDNLKLSRKATPTPMRRLAVRWAEAEGFWVRTTLAMLLTRP